MNGVYVDFTGKRVGFLTVICEQEKQNKHRVWLCRCDCGKEKLVRSDHLKDGRVVSCGCYRNRRATETKTKHGQHNSRLYYVWRNMLNRCYNPNVRSFVNYGANGVTVCDEWRKDFSAFAEWAYSAGYDPNAKYGDCTIDRINVYGNYCPENCRWVDEKTQANNRRKKVV